MSSEELRQAAGLMRERAEAAKRFIDLSHEWWGPDGLRDAFVAFSADEETVLWGFNEDAEHIASWHPVVALAVADSLIAAAAHIESHDCEAHCEPDGCELVLTATRTARAYLGTAQ